MQIISSLIPISHNYLMIMFFLFSSCVIADTKDLQLSQEKITDLLQHSDKVRISDVELFNKNLEQLTQLQKTHTFTPVQSCYHQYLLAYDHGYKGQYDVAKKMLEDIFESCDDSKSKIRSKLLLSNLQVISYDYGPAISNLDYPISQINQIDDNELKNRVYSKAALVYRLVDQYELSLKFAELLLNNQPSDAYYCNGLVAKYRILMKTDKPESIEGQIQETIKICEDNNEFILSNFLKLEWFDLQLNNSHSTEDKVAILNELKASEQQINTLKYQNLISIKDSIFAKVYWSLGDDENAFRYANLSLTGSKDIGNTKQEIVALQVLVDYYRKFGQAEQAINMLIRKNESERVQYNDQQAKTMAYLTIQHENLAKSHQINILNQKNVVLSLENELAEKTALVQQLIILSLLVLVAFFVLWGIKHKKIQQLYKGLSQRDHMTLIYNRKGLRDHIDELLPNAYQKNQEVCLAIFDLDLFKNINDQYGHITGDWVIKNVIKTCENLSNGQVELGRLGGEEFAIIYSNANINDIEEYCELCREHIATIDTSETGHQFTISASFGITSTKLSGYSYTKMLTDADEALYLAKNSGRNQTIIFSKN